MISRVQCDLTGLTLHVRLMPNASRDAVEAWRLDVADQAHLAVRVRAVPEKGKANAALITLLAKQLSIPKRDVDVIRGATSRLKTVRIAALEPELSRIVAQLEGFADERAAD